MSLKSQLRSVWLAAVALCVQGCASDRVVDCESHLEPINAPAPITRHEQTRNSAGKSLVTSEQAR